MKVALALLLAFLTGTVLVEAASHSVASINVTYIECSGTPARLENGSIVCVKCISPFVVNNETLKCGLPKGTASVSSGRSGSILNKLTPESPGLATLLLWLGGGFLAYKLLKSG